MVHMGSERGEPLIITAVRCRAETVAPWLLESEISVNVRLKGGMTPLHHAAHHGRRQMTLLLIKRWGGQMSTAWMTTLRLHYIMRHFKDT
jgi:hypothetical protein